MESAKWIKMIVDVVNNITLITNDPNFNMEIAKLVIQISSYSAHLLMDFDNIYTEQLNTLNNYYIVNNNNDGNDNDGDDDDNDVDNIKVDNSRYDHLLNLISNFQSFLFLYNHKNNTNNLNINNNNNNNNNN